MQDYQGQSCVSPQVSPQVRNCGLAKKIADLRTCGLWQFKLRTCGCGLFLILVRNSANFIQILKFHSIFLKYLCFYPVKHDNSITSFFEFKFGKIINFFEFRLTKIPKSAFRLNYFVFVDMLLFGVRQNNRFLRV